MGIREISDVNRVCLKRVCREGVMIGRRLIGGGDVDGF